MLETTFVVSHPRDVRHGHKDRRQSTKAKNKDFTMNSPQPTDSMYAGEVRTYYVEEYSHDLRTMNQVWDKQATANMCS